MEDNSNLPLDLNMALRHTFAVVMAGGRGTRLKQLTDNQAKPAVPFAGKFRIIDFPLSNCVNSGIRRVSVLTQYRAHTLIQHVQNGWGFLRGELNEFVQLWPAQQQTASGSWYLGTADAVFQNIETLQPHNPQYIIVLAGDHVYRQDYSRMLAEHIEKGADATVACVEVPIKSATEFGVVGVKEGDEIVSFLEKPADPPCIPGEPDLAFASMGIYVFNADFLYDALRRDAQNPESSHDFGKDVVPGLVSNCRLLAHRFGNSCVYTGEETEPYWRDVGTVDAYWEANLDLTSVSPSLNLYDRAWPIWTYQAQRPAAKFVFDDEERRGMAVDSLVSAGCIVSGSNIRRSLLFTDIHAHSYTTVEDSVILPRCQINRDARLKKVIVDQDCDIPSGLVVGEDPELDAKRFYRTENGVTLITAKMLEKL
ncbi:MAG: glucose-1-phosphate adenylyltransferase [Rhodospirillales bacterium]|nr:glucose-1-phosphate adenylyltransferase [Rhodospirillales bacterium]